MKPLIIILFFISFAKISVYAQTADSLEIEHQAEFKHIVKLRLLSTLELIQNYNRQILGFEYEYRYKKRTSWVLDFDFGFFDKYIYYQYFDFFTSQKTLPYTKSVVVTKGVHIIPEYRYYYFSLSNTSNDGFYIGGASDIHFYKKDFSKYDSRTEQTDYDSYKTLEFALGGELGLQLQFKERLAVDFSISGFYALLSWDSDSGKHIPSKNASWISDNEAFWVNYQLKLGYAFGK